VQSRFDVRELPGWRKMAVNETDTLVEKFLKELREDNAAVFVARVCRAVPVMLTGRRFSHSPPPKSDWTPRKRMTSSDWRNLSEIATAATASS